MKLLRTLTIGTAAAVLGLVSACGGSGSTPSGTTPTATPTTTAPTSSPPVTTTTSAVHVYFLHGEKVVSVHRDVKVTGKAVATAALKALLAGPTADERDAGISTTIPTDTALNGVTVANGTADVDLTAAYESGGGSLSMTGRLMQVVFTVTQFPTVQRVTFRLDGKTITTLGGEGVMIDKPQTRADYESFVPAIFIDSPAWGETVTSPVEVRGVANVFEGQFTIEVRDAAGKVLVTGPGRATMGKLSPFSTKLYYTASKGPGRVIGFDNSAKDGSRIDVYSVPVTLR